jgi:NAD(P) transhydrogenase subunit beta
MSDLLKYAIELVAVLLLALGIKGLSKVRSARGANQLAAVTGRKNWQDNKSR